MNTAVEIKKERLNLRMASNVKEKIEQAARFQGKTVSNFILTCVTAHAEEIISNNKIKMLSEQDAINFIAAIENPTKLNDKLTAAFKRHSERVLVNE